VALARLVVRELAVELSVMASRAVDATRARRGQSGLVLACVVLGEVMVGLDATVVVIANPAIATDFHASLSQLQWITNSYLLVLTVLLILGGRLGDRYGRRRAFLIGAAGFALTSLGVGLVGSISGVIALRATQGAFGALLVPNTLALLRAAVPEERLNMAIGVWSASSAAAIAGAPIIGGLLVEHATWQSVFYLNVPVGLVTLLAGLWILPESRARHRGPLDVRGVVVLAMAVFALVFGVMQAPAWGWGSAATVGLLLASLALFGAFALVERGADTPLVPLWALRRRSVSLGLLAACLSLFALFAALFFLSLYLENLRGDSAVGAALRMLPLTLLFAAASPLAAWVTGRFGPQFPVTVGLLAVAVSLFGIANLGAASSLPALWLYLSGLGAGLGFVIVGSAEAVITNLPVDDAGLAGGLQASAVQLGGVLGASLLGSVLIYRTTSVLAGTLVAAGVPRGMIWRIAASSPRVVQGLVDNRPFGSVRLHQAVAVGSHAAFLSGFRWSFTLGAVIALVGACLGPFIRSNPTT
jgi:EmrB/QacA subfamily drug resistance transporter